MAKTKRVPKNITPVVINGEEMFLKYNLYAMKQMQKHNVDLTKLGQTDENGNTVLDWESIIIMLWAGLITYDPTITPDDVAMLVDIGDMQYLQGKLQEAMQSEMKGKKLISLGNLTWENICEYGYGLLRLKPDELYEMDVRDFLDMVNGAVSWDRDLYETQLDIEMQYLSRFAASIMYSSGNYKKSTKIEKLMQSLYIPLKDREASEKKQRQSGKPQRSHKSSPADKVEELKRRFNL